MEAEYYRTEIAELVDACCRPTVLQAYIVQLGDELPRCGDAALLRQLRAHLDEAQGLLGDGLERRMAIDRGAVDALLSDLLAVATWEGWPLPLQREDNGPLPLEPLPRGLLGADEAVGAAMVFALPDGRIALCRSRGADRNGDMSEHWQHPH